MKRLPETLASCVVFYLVLAGCHSTPPAPQPAAAVPAAAAPKPAPPAPPRKLVCANVSSDDAQGADFVESLSFFTLMQNKLGGWVSCSGKKLNATDEEITVTFPGGASMKLSSFPSSDASAEEAVLPASGLISRADAIDAIRQGNPPDGCGMDWSKLSAGGASATGDFKASGTTCTVDAHVKVANGAVVSFGFSVAA